MLDRSKRRIVILPGTREWEARVTFPIGDIALRRHIKQWPGTWWDKDGDKQWRVALDMLPKMREKAKALGYVSFYEGIDWLPGINFKAGLPPEELLTLKSTESYSLYNFQTTDIFQLFNLLKGHVVWEMGLGKAILSAVLMLLDKDSLPALVVAPRQGISPVVNEMAKWAPDIPVHEIKPTAKKRWLVKPDAVNVISFGLVERAVAELDWPKLGRLHVDEIHSWANDNTHQTQAGRALIRLTDPDKLIGMTGTLLSNRVDSMLNPLDILYPGRFKDNGNPNHFYYRHMQSTPGDHGSHFYGVREDTLGELQERLALTGVRRTKDEPEVAAAIPKFTGPVPVETDDRFRTTKELVLDAFAQGNTHVTAHAYRRASAHRILEEIQRRLPKGTQAEVLTGVDSTERRDRVREALVDADRAFLVTTISSMKLAIDLSPFQVAVYAELTNNLEEMLQSIGRYPRLSKKATPTHMFFVYEKGDTAVVHMANKIKVYNMVQGKDFTSAKAAAALEEMAQAHKLTSDDVAELMRLAVHRVRTDFDSEDWKESEL